ncbi:MULTISPECIES: MBL fold metallo-hydrolase [unclassified Paenibacillus]|uniref:MBL fold metallo-hydrolase n=1 Tax=unclassified Paenibacillus TaxID=185978 RepID=UPI0008BD3554|nr:MULTISPECIES: MBL fold metallo-hydrolase [unclassified Paenibacillus]QLG38473.1 MBL fold metallo-hydrolase [Paenibacillus sp. E222]SEP19410.1 L-ascorbate metabolism protein UlaG, beta-lactamase superfamily [Paenibacillus sp. OK076]
MPKIRYNNIDNVSTDKTLKEFKQWREQRRSKVKDYSYTVPKHPPELDYLHANRAETTITWIGHSTFFIQYHGLNIVTDPVWAEKMGFQRRLGAPGIPIQDIPPLDVILISHSHYDHLHLASLRKLVTAKTLLIVPDGLKRKMVRKGFHRCHEMKWWEHITLGGVKITFVPAQHWTRRTLFDTNTSHWGGYVLEQNHPAVVPSKESAATSEGHGYENSRAAGTVDPIETSADHSPGGPPVIYFVGDTGYFQGFKTIGERFDIGVTLMPIGAYEPEWFMTSQHVTPEEALQGFVETGSQLMVPMHYGTFKLADDTPKEALDRMEVERERLGISAERIRVLGHGETLRIRHEESKQD